MTLNETTVTDCESCGWNHEDVEIQTEEDYYDGKKTFFICLLTKEKVYL